MINNRRIEKILISIITLFLFLNIHSLVKAQSDMDNKCIFDSSSRLYLSTSDLWVDSTIQSISKSSEETVELFENEAKAITYAITLKIHDHRYAKTIKFEDTLDVEYVIFKLQSNECEVNNQISDYLDSRLLVNSRYFIKLGQSNEYSDKVFEYGIDHFIETNSDGKTLSDNEILPKESSFEVLTDTLKDDNPANKSYTPPTTTPIENNYNYRLIILALTIIFIISLGGYFYYKKVI